MRIPVCLALITATSAFAQDDPGEVLSFQKISATQGGLNPGGPGAGDNFGHAVAFLGDLDGDSIGDVAVGASHDDAAGFDAGAVWILFLNMDGTVKAKQKITTGVGGFTGALSGGDDFGAALAAPGDIDADGIQDLVVGARADDDGSFDAGAVWILFLNPNGTVKGHQKISDTQGNFNGILDSGDGFGISVAPLGDRNHDGTPDIVVGARWDDDGGLNRGAAWLLRLKPDGSVLGFEKISNAQAGGGLANDDVFGSGVASPGDLDGDGIDDLAVGAMQTDDGGNNNGAIWIFLLKAAGGLGSPVKSFQKISMLSGGFTGTLASDEFGSTVAAIGDYDFDGVNDLAVGARRDGPQSSGGTLWILTMKPNGTVKANYAISDTMGNFAGNLAPGDEFANTVTALDDQNGDGFLDLLVGAWLDDDGGSNIGSAYVLNLSRACPEKVQEFGAGCAGSGGFVPRLTTTNCPDAGGPAGLRVERGLGGSIAVILFGLSPAAIPIGATGCVLSVAPVLGPTLNVPLGGVGPGNGSVTLLGTVPASAAGLSVALQVFVADATPQGYSNSNGLLLKF